MRISDWTSDVCSSDLPVAETGPELVIRGGRLFDAVGGCVRPATVVIQGNLIKAVLPPDATGWGADAKIIDAAGKTVMPGLIDMHTHVTYPDRASDRKSTRLNSSH